MTSKITFCLTSCNRFDLLETTLDSFFALNTYPIERFIVTEDSGKLEMKEKILHKYGNKVELIFNEVNRGPFPSIDTMYQMVETEYIFFCEDDWHFFPNSEPNFMQHSLDILEERKDLHQVWIRKDAQPDWIENEIHKTSTDVSYKLMKVPHCGGWCGFSGNPGLRRKSDYLTMFPNGYSAFIKPSEKVVFTEYNCNVHAMNLGYRAASLINSNCVHIGNGRTTIG